MTRDDLELAFVPRQQFGQRLKDLRLKAKLESQDVARQVGISADLVSRVELGERWPRPDVVTAWAQVTDSGDQSDDLLADLDELKQRESRLRAEAQKFTLAQTLRSDLFRKSSTVRTFAVTEIPFYLQTAEYARQSVGDVAGVADVVSMRREDNDSVGSQGRNIQVVLAESALRYFPCDTREMRRQISELQSLIDKPGVEFGVIPLGTQNSTPLLSAFSLFDKVAVVESFAGAIDLTPKSGPRYNDLMDRICGLSVQGDAARALLTAAANALPAS